MMEPEPPFAIKVAERAGQTPIALRAVTGFLSAPGPAPAAARARTWQAYALP